MQSIIPHRKSPFPASLLKIVGMVLFSGIYACTAPTKGADENTSLNAELATPIQDSVAPIEEIPTAPASFSDGELPQFETVLEMLEAMGDYSGRTKCLEEVDGKADHIRVCFDYLLHDDENSIPRRTRTTVIHVAMQAFAMTASDHLSITCMPMGTTDGQSPSGKLDQYAKTVTVTRKQADKVMQKYLDTSDYATLMEKQGAYWTTSADFDKLFKQDAAVYRELTR